MVLQQAFSYKELLFKQQKWVQIILVTKMAIFDNFFSKEYIFQTFWKLHCVTKSLFFKLETSNFGYLLIFNFAELCKVSERLDNIDIRHFIRVPPLMFFDFLIYKKFKGRALIKCLISMLPNLVETLHSSAKLKNKQVVKI